MQVTAAEQYLCSGTARALVNYKMGSFDAQTLEKKGDGWQVNAIEDIPTPAQEALNQRYPMSHDLPLIEKFSGVVRGRHFIRLAHQNPEDYFFWSVCETLYEEGLLVAIDCAKYGEILSVRVASMPPRFTHSYHYWNSMNDPAMTDVAALTLGVCDTTLAAEAP